MLNIEVKEDSAEKLASAQGKPTKYYLFSHEFNAIVQKINYIDLAQKKKIENTRYKSTLSGENIIIPFQAAGQSHYSVTNATLVSVAGFTTAGLTTPMYEGQDVIFENQTGHDITLKDSFGVDTSFVIGADLIVPNEGKIWFRFRNNELELIDKNWFKINEVATAQNLGEFINSLDSKTDVKDTDEFVLSDSDDGLKSKKTRFLDLKTKLKSYFDTFYLSLSIFNDFVTDVFSSLDNKLDKSTTPSSVYTTDAEGLQVMKPISEFQTPVGDYVTLNTTQTVDGNKTFNDVGLIKKNSTSIFPNQSGGNFYIGDNGGYDRFEFISLDGYDQEGYGFSQIYSNAEDGSGIVHNSLDGQIASMLNINQYDTYLRNKHANQNTTLYVDGQNRKVRIEGTQNKIAALGTSLITGNKNFEFPNNNGTLALLSDLTGYATQTWVTLQGYITNVITSLGYTPENVANKSSNTSLGTSNDLYPTQNAVKTYVDNGLDSKQNKIYSIKVTTPSLTVNGTVSETQVLRVEIPPNSLSLNEIINMPLLILTKTGTAGTCEIRVKISTASTMPFGNTYTIARYLSGASNLFVKMQRNFIIDDGTIKVYPLSSNAIDNTTSASGILTKSFDPTVTNYLYVSLQQSATDDSSVLQGFYLTNQ